MGIIKTVKPAGVSILVALVVTGCQWQDGPVTGKLPVALNKSNQLKLNTSITGKAEFPEKFQTKATTAEIAGQATVSLIYPSDYKGVTASFFPLRNVTAATGLTKDDGSFVINPDASFVPETGVAYVLSASKRLGGVRNSLISLQTHIKWNGSKWESITTPDIYINSKTTALSVISGFNPSTIATADLINKITIDNSTGTPTSVLSDIKDANQNILVSAATISNVASLVNQVLLDGQDPYASIDFTNGNYFIRYFNSPDSIQFSSGFSSPTAVPGSPFPTGTPGGGITQTATFNGKVYDPNGITVEGATVTAKSVDANVSWVGATQITTNGAYVFRNAPVGGRIEITVFKDGWATKTRTEVLKSNLQGDPTANVFDFGGLGSNGTDATSSYYAIQDEPEIVSVKINGRQATSSGGFSTSSSNNGKFGIANVAPTGSAQLRSSIDANGQPLSVSLAGVDNDRLDVELTFSEPVDRQSVQNNFKIISQNFDVRPNTTGFEIDENLSTLNFTWAADDRSVLVKANKPILTTTTTPEARYLLKWTNPFQDKTAKQALKVGQGTISPTGHFRYNPGTNNDFNVFGVKIDDQLPRLLSVSAFDGGSANDVIRLTFNEPLEVINQVSLAFGLADPTDPTNSSSRQLWAYNTANSSANADPLGGDGTTANQATVVGYAEGGNTLANFKAVYMIARLQPNIINKSQINTTSLAQGLQINGGNISSNTPSKGNPTAVVTTGSLLRFAKIDGNVVTLEFAPEAFNRNEKIIVSVGGNIASSYQDTGSNIPATPVQVNNTGKDGNGNSIPFSYSTKTVDPAGNIMSVGNPVTSGNLSVNDSLRVATAS